MIGLLSGVAKDNSQIDVIFEVYYTPSGLENTYSLFGSLANVSQNTDGSLAVSVAGVQVAGKKPKKTEIKVMTFDNFQRSSSGRWATHEIIGEKAKLEYISPGLEEIGFSVLLSTALGVVPDDELKKLRQIRDEGITCLLMIGDEPVTDNLVVLQKIDESHREFDGKGKVLTVSVNLSLTEYVE